MKQSKVRVRQMLTVVTLAAAIAAPLAGNAHATTPPNSPFAIAAGNSPSIAVGPGGTGYVAWIGTDSNSLHLCTIHRGARACARSATLPLPSGDTATTFDSRPYVLLAPPANGHADLAVVADRCCTPGSTTWLWTSNNLGVSWNSPHAIGDTAPSGAAVAGPGNAVTVITDITTGGVVAQQDANAFPADGSAPTANTTTNSPFTQDEYANRALVAPSDGSLFAATWDSFNSQQLVHVYRVASGVDANSTAAWTKVATIAGQQARLAAGPHGTFLFSASTGTYPRLRAQKWTGSGFGSMVLVNGANEDDVFPTFHENVAGRLMLAYDDTHRNLVYRTSTDGVHWAGAVLASGTSYSAHDYNLDVATAGDGGGWVASDENTAGGPGGRIWLTAIPMPQSISVVLKPTTVTRGSHATLTGRVLPHGGSPYVYLQRWTGRSWTTLTHTQVGSTGWFAFTIVGSTQGTFSYRVVRYPSEGYALLISHTVVLRVS